MHPAPSHRNDDEEPRRSSTAARGRVRWRAACVGLLTLLAVAQLSACSDESSEPIVRVFESLSEVSLSSTSTGLDAHEYVETRTAADDEWFALRVEKLAMGEGEPEGASRSPDGELLLGPGSGAWIRLVDVSPGEPLILTAELDGSGLGVDYTPPFCNLGLVQFDERPSLEQLRQLAKSGRLRASWTPNFPFDRSAARPRLITVTEANTHAVAIVCLFTGQPGDQEARVSYSNISLRRASSADRRASIVSRGIVAASSENPKVGEVEIGMMTRPSLCLLSGDEVSLPVELPATDSRFEVYLGVPTKDDDPWSPEVGSTTSVRCELILEGASAPLFTFEQRLELRPFGDGRWTFKSEALPPEARGSRGRLVFTSGGSDEPATRAPAVVVGNPRFVPELPTRAGPNVILISLDTLRSDHLGCYGYDRDTTPNIDSFAEGARVYTDVWASSCYTLPSHMSMLTGQQPSMHTVTKPGFLRNPARSPLLAELLYQRGYTTAAFTGGVFVDREFGFAAGFESYGAVDLVQLQNSTITDHRVDVVAGLTHELIQENDIYVLTRWIEEHARESFFVFFHTYASHEFDPPKRHRLALGFEQSLSLDPESQGLIGGGGFEPTAEEVARLVDLYDGGVRFADEAVGALLAQLEASDLVDDTIVIITADHGKEIGEHGIVGHGHALYEELLQVPLLVRIPPKLARAGADRGVGVDGRPAMLVDIVPSILELLDLAVPANLQGHSVFGKPAADRIRLAEVENLAIKYAMRRGSLKTIHNPLDAGALIENTVEEESFDLAADPAEQSPLAPDPARVAELERQFQLLKTLSRALGERIESGHLSDSTADQLRALGYVENAKQ